MSFVKGWTVLDENTIRLDFKSPSPPRQITDLLQFVSVIDPAGIDSVETKPAGTGAYMLAERAVGQRIRLAANPHYWRAGEPVAKEVAMTIFSEDASASAALESGSADLIYGTTPRSGVRLRNAGYQLVSGPGPLVQVLRINPNRGPFRNEKFRQAFTYLTDRASILRVGYAGLGEVVALPWAPASPAFDKSYNEKYAFNLDKAKALLTESGLHADEMSNWKLLVNAGDEPTVIISQLLQSTLAKLGIKITLDMRQGADFTDSMLGGKFDAMFGAVGNVQKFPSRLATNSIYRTANNVVLGSPNPFPAYVAAIDKINATLGPDDAIKAAYDNLNRVLVETAFGIPTNTFDTALMVATKNVSGFTLDIDNMFVARTIGFKP
jgi:peptide/nickel transport system substrate-binding protein